MAVEKPACKGLINYLIISLCVVEKPNDRSKKNRVIHPETLQLKSWLEMSQLKSWLSSLNLENCLVGQSSTLMFGFKIEGFLT